MKLQCKKLVFGVGSEDFDFLEKSKLGKLVLENYFEQNIQKLKQIYIELLIKRKVAECIVDAMK